MAAAGMSAQVRKSCKRHPADAGAVMASARMQRRRSAYVSAPLTANLTRWTDSMPGGCVDVDVIALRIESCCEIDLPVRARCA